MLTRIWDWLFRRYTYKFVRVVSIYNEDDQSRPYKHEYIFERDDGMYVRRRF